MRWMMVQTKDHSGRRQTVRLELISDGPAWLIGWEVDSNGTRTGPQHLIDQSTVISRKPLHQDLHYGGLVA